MTHKSDTCQVIVNIQSLELKETEVQTQLERFSQDLSLLVRGGHTDKITSVVFNPAGNIVASGANDGMVRLWEVSTGRLLHSLDGDMGMVSLAFSPTGDMVVVGSEGMVTLWDTHTGRPRYTMKAYPNRPLSLREWEPRHYITLVAFSPTGDMVAGGMVNGSVKLWEVRTGQLLHTLEESTFDVNSIAFSPTRDRIAIGAWNRVVKMREVCTGKLLYTLNDMGVILFFFTILKFVFRHFIFGLHYEPERPEIVPWLAFSPTGDVIATGLWNGTVTLGEVRTGRLLHTLKGHKNEVTSVAFSPAGDVVASGSLDRTVKLWETGSGKLLNTLKGHTAEVMSVAFSPTGDVVASGSLDGTVALWETHTSQILHAMKNQPLITSVAFSSTGDVVASGSSDGSVKLWDMRTGQPLRTLEVEDGFIGEVSPSLAFSPGGDVLASGSLDGTIKLWDIRTGQPLRTLEDEFMSEAVISLAFSPTGDVVVSGTWNGSVKLRDVRTGRTLKTLKAHRNAVTSVAFSPAGNIVASASLDTHVKLWDTSTGRLIHSLEGNRSRFSKLKNTLFPPGSLSFPSCVDFSPKGDLVVSSCPWDGTAKLWETSTARLLYSLKGDTECVTSVAFSPNGDIVATGGGWDKTVILWEVSTRKILFTLKGHTSIINSLAFNPTGNAVVSGAYDGTVKVWSVRTGCLLATLLSISPNEWMAYTPEGYYIGSENIANKVMMKFEWKGQLYPKDLFSRDNPNPQKVVEALNSIRVGEAQTKQSATPPKALSSKPPALLTVQSEK